MKLKILLVTVLFILSSVTVYSQLAEFTYFNDETYDTIDISDNTLFVKGKVYSDANIDLYLDDVLCEKGKYDEFFCSEFSKGNVFIDAKPSDSGVVEWSLYENIDTTDLTVFGTQYFQGEQIRSFVQLLDNSVPIDNATCYIDIIDPSNEYFKENQLMMRFNESHGLYYFDTIATDVGIHMLNVECYYNMLENQNYPVAYQVITGVDKGHPLSRMTVDDGVYFETEDTGKVIDVYYNFSNIILSDNNVTSATILLNGVLEVGGGNLGAAEFSIWNFTSSMWQPLPNQWIGNDNQEDTVSNTVDLAALNNSFLQNGNLNVRINDTSDPGQDLKKFKIDLFEIVIEQLQGQTINNIRGGGEIHVQIPIVNFTATLNASLDAAILDGISSLNDSITNNKFELLNELFITNQSIHEKLDNQTVILLQELYNVNVSLDTSILDAKNMITASLLGINNSIINSIGETNLSLSNFILDAIREININTNTSISIAETNIINAIDSFHFILNGTLADIPQDIILPLNTSIYSSAGDTVTLLSIAINDSQSVLVGAIGNDTTIIQNSITNSQYILNTSILNSEGVILNSISNAILELNTSIYDVNNTQIILDAINGLDFGNDTPQLLSFIGNDTAFISGLIGNDTEQIISAIGNDTAYLSSIIGNDTTQLLTQITSSESILLGAIGNDTDYIVDTLISSIGNDTAFISGLIGNDTDYIVNTIISSRGNDTQSLLDSINSLDFGNDTQIIIDALNDTSILVSFFGNDTPSIISKIGNDTDIIIEALNQTFGNDSQQIIDAILVNTTSDIDSLLLDVNGDLLTLNNSIKTYITDQINDVQSDISTQTTTITGAITSATSTITTNSNTNTNTILTDADSNANDIMNLINSSVGSINLTIDTFSIASSVWNFGNRTLSDFMFNVSISNGTLTDVQLNENTTNLITGNVAADFEVGMCPDNSGEVFLLVGMGGFASVLMIIGFAVPVFGVFGSLALIVLSWYVTGCIGLIGYIFAGIGIIGLVFYVLKKPSA